MSVQTVLVSALAAALSVCALAAEPSTEGSSTMPKLFEASNLSVQGKMVPYKDFKPMADASRIHCPEAVARAEQLLGKGVPALPASLYLEFFRNGNRVHYEGPYFERRANALTLLLAELTEKKGRFTDLLVDYVWAICEESTWVIPAHNTPHRGHPETGLVDAFSLDENDDVRYVDLFAADTGAKLAWISYLGKDLLDGVSPEIRRRIHGLIKQRVLHPFADVKGEGNWWMGEHSSKLNNWTPWISANALTAMALVEEDDARRELIASRAILFLDRFASFYAADGGCDEGPSYWTVAGAAYFNCCELIRDLTGGQVSLFDNPYLEKMCAYIVDVNLGGDLFANFADAPHRLGLDWALIARMGRELGSAKLTAFAAENADPKTFREWNTWRMVMQSVRDHFEPLPEKKELPAATGAFYPNLGVMVQKNAACGMILCAKGGNNAESHNHNDVGSFILFRDGKPVFLDPGVETYTRDTFSDKRYTLWAMRSISHNLPLLAGKEQLPGTQYRAEILSCENGALKMELKNAYPADTGLEAFVRTVSLTDDGCTVTDEIRFTKPSAVSFSLMCHEKPKVNGNAFTLPETGSVATFDPTLTYAEDSIPLTDPKLHAEWETDALTRVRLEVDAVADHVFTLTVR